MFEYGKGFHEQNDAAIAKLKESMSPEAIALAEQMADELLEDILKPRKVYGAEILSRYTRPDND